MSGQPNILFIISDQHNAKVMGHKGHPDVKTPNLDRLASEGVRFDNAITQNCICTPSRVSYFSGQYCHNHGYYGLSGPNPNGLPTVLGHFRGVGYRTAAIGKIHCPEYWIEDDCDLFEETCGCSIGGRDSYAKYLSDKNLTHLEDHGGYQEFGSRGRQTVEGRPSKVSFEDSQEGWTARETVRFMKECAAENKPFFAHASLPKPHQCYAPSEPFWSMYDEEKLTLPPNADYEMNDKAPNLRRTAEHWRNTPWQLFEPKTFEAGRLRKLHGYLGSVSHVDHAVGEILKGLDEAGLADNTIVIYTADHGDFACEHSILEKAPGISSDAITRIPHIWRWPKEFKAGHVAREIVETVDMTATLCSLAGLDPMETGDGKDITQLLKGESEEIHKIGVTEFAWSKSVRKGNYRYVYYPTEMFADKYPDGFGELYDIEADPWEMENLYFKEEYAAKVQEMKADFLEWLITTTRPVTAMAANPAFANQSAARYSRSTNFDGKLNPDALRKHADDYFENANYL